MMCLVLTSLMYLNSEETILTHHMKERPWLIQEMNTLRKFLTIKNEYNDCHGLILSSKNIKEAVLHVMEEEEEEIKLNTNNITCDTSFQSPICMNVQKKDANWSLERQLASGILAEMVENFKGYTVQSD